MSATLMPNGKHRFYNLDGSVLAGGKLFTYAAGTVAPKATYFDQAATIPNTNPVILDIRGEALVRWDGAYKYVLTTATGVVIETIDDFTPNAGLLTGSGAGLIGFNYANTYLAGSIGKWLQDLALAAGSSFIGFLQNGAGAVKRTVLNKLRESVSITDFGADPAAADNRSSIQSAIDSATGYLYIPPGVFDVTLDPAAAGLPGVFGNASVALKPRSNLRIYGPGTIRLKTGQNGTSGAIIGNWDGALISNFILDGITLDGNSANTTGQVSGCVLVDATECGYTRVKVKTVTYCGLQMRRSAGYDGTSNYGIKDCWADFCLVTGAGYIGMQFNRPNGLRLLGNKVDTTTDNAYDIEGDDPAGGQSNAGFGKGIRVFENDADNIGGTGYFIESVGDVMFNNNRSREAAFGAYFNRIHSGALGNTAIGNKFSRTLFKGGNGLTVSNNSGDMRISENDFDGFDNSLWLVNTGVYVTVGTNYHKNVGKYMIGYGKTTNAVVKCHVQRQIMRDLPGLLYGTPQAYPALNPPYNCPSNSSTRAFRLVVEDGFSLESGTAVSANFKIGDGVLVFSSGWAGYSLYNFGSDGKTRVYLSSLPAGYAYAIINSTAYKLTPVGDGSIYVSQWNGAAYVDGNFTAVLNSALAAALYPSFWVTE